MSNSKQIIESLFADDLYTAKKAITEVLTSKMAQALEDKLIDFAPEVFNESSKPDLLDLDRDGNKTEPMRKAARDKKKVGKRVNMKEDIEDLAEDFENQLKSLVEEIEEETGEQLSEEEIIDIANMLIDMIAEDHVDGDEDHDDDEDDDDDDDDEDNDEDQPTATNYRLGTNSEY